jgi:hypothetical protein
MRDLVSPVRTVINHAAFLGLAIRQYMAKQTTKQLLIFSLWGIWLGFRPFLPGIMVLVGLAIALMPAILLMWLIRWAVTP